MAGGRVVNPPGSDPRCLCAHRLSEHPEKYGLRMCSGHVLAIDESEDDGSTRRRAPCYCVGFLPAPEDLLRQWGDLPARTGAPDAPPGAVTAREGVGRRDVAPRASTGGGGAK
jgi:hypothetical protein